MIFFLVFLMFSGKILVIIKTFLFPLFIQVFPEFPGDILDFPGTSLKFLERRKIKLCHAQVKLEVIVDVLEEVWS